MWNPGTIQDLIDRWQYNTGRVGMGALRGVIDAVRQSQASQDYANPALSNTTSALNDTAQVLRTSAGRLYLIRVTNASAAAVVITLTDGGDTIVVGGCHVPAAISGVPGVAEVAFLAGSSAIGGAGQIITTSLRARAFLASDGTTGASSGVTVTALTSA